MKFKSYVNEIAFMPIVIPIVKSVFFKQAMQLVWDISKDQGEKFLKKKAKEMVTLMQSYDIEEEFVDVVNKFTKMTIGKGMDIFSINEDIISESYKDVWNIFKKDGWKLLEMIPALQIWHEIDKLLEYHGIKDAKFRKTCVYGAMYIAVLLTKKSKQIIVKSKEIEKTFSDYGDGEWQ